MNARVFVLAPSALLATALGVACSAGGSSSPATVAGGASTYTVTFSVSVPSPILSSGAQSVAITYVPVGETVPAPAPPLIINVAPGSSDCATAAAKTVCSGTLAVPAGQQNFTLSVYPQAGGKGPQLTVKSFVEMITGATAAFDISNANGAVGVLSSVELVLTPATISYGTPSTIVVSIVPKDASGNTLAGALTQPVSIIAPPTPTPPAVPIFFAPTAVSGPANLDANGNPVILDPARQYAFAYSGTRDNLSAQIPFTASAANIPPVTAYVTLTGVPTPQPSPTAVPTPTIPPSPTPIPVPTAGPVTVTPSVLLFEAPNAPAQIVVASESGVIAFSAISSDRSIATVTVSGTQCTVTPHAPGAAAITISGASGKTGTVFVYVSLVSITIQARSRHT